ncbi:MAG TPA: hypothetical protein VG246_13045 [Acidimicrobiales bacterium]|jgi:hypothetical protein|nr:hypothetical protein [Acidimicrobiales bacterium]
MNTETLSQTEQVAEDYAASARAVEMLQVALDELQKRDIKATSRSLRASLRMLSRDAEYGPKRNQYAESILDDIDISSLNDGVCIAEAYYGECLEIIMHYRRSLSIPNETMEVSQVELLLGFGGPNVRMFIDFDGGVTIQANWSGEAKRDIYAPNISDWAQGLAGCYDVTPSY